jgi:hypothetical protein
MKPVLFIGSSKEGLAAARALEVQLERYARVNLWTSDLFQPGGTTIESLFDQLDTCHHAVFILTADDLVLARDREWVSPRDNVVFELGLFMGHLGRGRVFVVHDRDCDLKLPSDLAGVTMLTFSGERLRENSSAALSPVATRLLQCLSAAAQPGEIDFLKAYLAFVRPNTKLSDTYSDILSHHYNAICVAVAQAEQKQDWYSLLEIKIRLREYFEYAGRYIDGVDFGRRYVKALMAVGDEWESLWTRVKHVAYLLILSNQHAAGREELLSVLKTLEKKEASDRSRELAYYAHRYISISFLRDPALVDRSGAKLHLDRATEIAAMFPDGSTKRMELDARLQTNQGNITLESGNASEALAHYQCARALFESLDDLEHVGIAHLKIAEALNQYQNGGDAAVHLERAESIFLQLGWIEGHARVLEQRAYYRSTCAGRTDDLDVSHSSRHAAIADATRARSLYERLGNQQGIGRTEALLRELKRRTENT